MKKNLNLFLAALAVMTVSCLKENAPQADESLNPTGEFELQVAAPDDVTVDPLGTKTVMVPEGNAYAVNWSEDDAISVNGTTSVAINVEADNAKAATFTVSGVSAPFCAVYPAAVASGFAQETAVVALPAEQKYVAGSFDPAASVMLGYAADEEGTLAFSHAMTYLYLTINTVDGYDNDNIRTVTVKSLGTEPMSGAFKATFGAESCTLAPAEGNASTEVTLDCGQAGVAKGTPVVIAIPAGTYPSGLVITITDVNGDVTTQTAAAELAFKTGYVYTANLRVAAPGIYNVAGYNAFIKAVAAGNYDAWKDKDGVVNLYADLAVDKDYEYADAVVFDGVFNGNGHTMTSTDRSLPMFHTIGATGAVKNLNLVNTFRALTQFGEGAFSGFAKVNLGLIDGCSHTVSLEDADFATDKEFDHTSAGLAFGGFVWANGGTIQNSTMNGTINIAYTIAADKNACYGGGFAALGHTVTPYESQNVLNTNEQCVAGKFINCTNNAYIKIHTNKKGAGRDAIGGICGMAYLDGVEFTDCINAGTVERTHNHIADANINYATSVGGILGQGASWYLTNCAARETKSKDKGFNAKLTNCQNTGTVSLIWRAAAGQNTVSSNNNPNTNVAVGGIVGAIVGNNTSDMAEITNCTTSGYVKGASWSADQRIIVLGGIAGIASYTDLSGNKVQGYVGSGEGVTGGSSTLAAAGGVVGTAVNGVAISGGEVTADLKLLFEVAANNTYTTESRYGICLGMAQFTTDKSSIKNVSIAPNSFVITTTSSKLTNPTLSKDNFESYLYGKLGASTPNVSDNIWAGN